MAAVSAVGGAGARGTVKGPTRGWRWLRPSSCRRWREKDPHLLNAFRESLTGQEKQAALGYLFSLSSLYFYVFTLYFVVGFLWAHNL